MGDHQQDQKRLRKIRVLKFHVQTFSKTKHQKKLKTRKYKQLMCTKLKISLIRNNKKRRQLKKLRLEKQQQEELERTFKD